MLHYLRPRASPLLDFGSHRSRYSFAGSSSRFGNRLSAGLPSRFVLLSAGVLPLLLQNVPFSTVMLTHGLWILFALWYVTPRAIFRTNGTSATSEPSG